MANTFLKCTWDKIKNQLIFAIKKVSDIKLLRLHLPVGSSTATAWQKRSPNFLPLDSRYPPTYSLFLQSIQTELTSKGHLSTCQSRTFRSDCWIWKEMFPLGKEQRNKVNRLSLSPSLSLSLSLSLPPPPSLSLSHTHTNTHTYNLWMMMIVIIMIMMMVMNGNGEW